MIRKNFRKEPSFADKASTRLQVANGQYKTDCHQKRFLIVNFG